MTTSLRIDPNDEFQKQANHIYQNTPRPESNTTLDKWITGEEKNITQPLRRNQMQKKKIREEIINKQQAEKYLAELKATHHIKDDPTYTPKLAGTKKTYPQQWSIYNHVKSSENILTISNILDEILNCIPFPKYKTKRGGQPYKLRDQIYCAIIQQFRGKASRQTNAILKECKKLRYIHQVPHFNTILRFLQNQDLEHWLKHLINISGLPLAQIETTFATDSTGMGLKSYERWFDIRLGSDSKKKEWKKVHITCGTQTHIITAITVTSSRGGDSPQLLEHLKVTQKVYKNLEQWLADKAYSSRDNFKLIYQAGALPFIPFKENIKATTPANGVLIWKKMAYISLYLPNIFLQNSRQRSNIETVNSMLKAKLRSNLRTHKNQSQINEVLAKCLVHNLTVLLQEAYELGIHLDFHGATNIPLHHE